MSEGYSRLKKNHMQKPRIKQSHGIFGTIRVWSAEHEGQWKKTTTEEEVKDKLITIIIVIIII